MYNWNDSQVQERMMRIGIEVATSAATEDDYYRIAVATLKQDATNRGPATLVNTTSLSNLQKLFVKQQLNGNSRLFFLAFNESQTPTIFVATSLDTIPSKYIRGQLSPDHNIPWLYEH